ncbi:hypothetical protein ARAM_006131 [Aspergillus rambellii]|uniref:RZ-type domain-containing protein n=2 Tax=Aspergillus subgen. Nidulantes TaxID=2720870 RepID=A0A0F8VTI2_9EURO|nr:hypothetical protein ARAM_006131 [Aspergillus rambellii]
MESMDAQMQLSKYYCLDDEGKPVEFKGSSRPFSMEDIKTCALCRGHLRDISRYGRLVRRALLDESTKRFILHVNREYLPLAEELVACNPTLRQFHPSEMSPWPQTIEIKGPSIAQIKTMRETLGKFGETRWGQILRLREKILTYQRHVSPDAQPLIRVLIMVENARQRDKLIGRFECDSGALQNKGILLAAALRIRLDIGLLIDFMHLRQQAQPLGRINVFMDLQETRDECRTLIDTAKEHKRPLQEAEGYVYLAQLHALESSRCSNSSDSQRHFQTGEEAIGAARLIMSNFPNQTRGLLEDVESVDEMLRTTFYTIVTYQERLVIARAMASEFLGTGHWYYCRNRHPFTVGECGGPIEQYFCPECGAPVGGFDHQTADGVTRAEDIEEHFVQAMP